MLREGDGSNGNMRNSVVRWDGGIAVQFACPGSCVVSTMSLAHTSSFTYAELLFHMQAG